MFNAVGFYISFVYLVSWLQMADGIAPARALEINSISMAVLLPVMVATGLLTDRFGRKPVLLLACVLGFVAAVPLFWLLHHPSLLLAQLGQLGLVLIVGLFCGTQPTIMVEATPLPVRCTAVSLGYNICLGVIGGLTPLAATWLVRAHRQRDRAGVPDHGGGGGHVPDAAVVSRDLSRAVRRRPIRRGRGPGVTPC